MDMLAVAALKHGAHISCSSIAYMLSLTQRGGAAACRPACLQMPGVAPTPIWAPAPWHMTSS